MSQNLPKASVCSVEENKESILGLYTDRSDVDLKIVCGESVWTEGASKRIEFKEEDPFLIARMLMYCYMLSWPELKMDNMKDVWKVENQWVSRLDTIVKMYALGEKYGLKGLKQEAGERFTARLDEGFLRPIEEFIAVIRLTYSTTPDNDRGLRDRAVECGILDWKTLWAQPGFKDGLTEIGDFINDVITKLREQVHNKRD